LTWPLAEASDVASSLTINEPGPLRWTKSLVAATPHFRRYLTQAAAIALTTELAELYGWDPFFADHKLFWFDDVKSLTPELASFAPSGGPIPDILFETPDGWMALESRGRSQTPPLSGSLPVADQAKRLRELESWARAAAGATGYEPKWGMGWVWFTASDSVVDLFDPGEHVQFGSATIAELDAYRGRVMSRFEESIRTTQRERTIVLGGERYPVSIRTAGDDQSESQEVVGAAVSTDGRRPRRDRISENFDVVPFGRVLFFGGRVPSNRRADAAEWVGELLEERLEG
jgi:hypothetical protein